MLGCSVVELNVIYNEKRKVYSSNEMLGQAILAHELFALDSFHITIHVRSATLRYEEFESSCQVFRPCPAFGSLFFPTDQAFKIITRFISH